MRRLRVAHVVPSSLPLFVMFIAACQSPRPPRSAALPPNTTQPSSTFALGSYHRPVSTRQAAAQRAFDQGLVWAYAFNHDEAARAFREAARIDDGLAMAHYGIALVNGPHINNATVDAARAREAWTALKEAEARAASAAPVEKALIEALAARYAWPQPADRRPLDAAYAQAMARVYARFSEDADVATLYAESLLDLRPWDQWTRDGKPQPGTPELLQALEAALRRVPDHPGALHLTIHALEASPDPGRARAAADALRGLIPDSSHLLHMPSHIDVRLGRWYEAAVANQRAIEADARYRARSPQLGFYRLYMAHNRQFLGYTAMMEGRSAVALEKTREVIAELPPRWVEENTLFADAFLTVPWEAQKRFGKWREILQIEDPGAKLPVASAYRRFLRAVSFAALGQLDDAERERAAFHEALPKVPKEALWGSNRATDALAVAVPYLDGEIAYQRGQLDRAGKELREAVKKEDALKYDEPPAWQVPSRHALGAVLLEARRYAEARATYEEDLARYPENGWSLHGLAKALRGLNLLSDAEAVTRRFHKAWSRADIKLPASCLCVIRGRVDRP